VSKLSVILNEVSRALVWIEVCVNGYLEVGLLAHRTPSDLANVVSFLFPFNHTTLEGC